VRHRALGLGLVLLVFGAVPNISAQEAEVEAAVHATLGAWSAGEYADFVAQYQADARGFFLDGGPLMDGGFNVALLQAAANAGFAADVDVQDLDVQIHGQTAISVAYLIGSLTLPGGLVMPGTWRYSETRVSTDDGWKVIQFHVSPQEGM
jgi:ketosteroid isomerase-like protein